MSEKLSERFRVAYQRKEYDVEHRDFSAILALIRSHEARTVSAPDFEAMRQRVFDAFDNLPGPTPATAIAELYAAGFKEGHAQGLAAREAEVERREVDRFELVKRCISAENELLDLRAARPLPAETVQAVCDEIMDCIEGPDFGVDDDKLRAIVSRFACQRESQS